MRCAYWEVFYMKKSLFTIRKKKRTKHPQIIVRANRTSFSSVALTHSKGRRRHKNRKLIKNPNLKDTRDAYYSKYLIEDFKFNYSKAFKNYSLSNEDIDEMIKFLESKKK